MALGRPQRVPDGAWVALAWSLGPGRVAAPTNAPRPALYLLYRLEWTRALNAREVSCRRLKWPRPSWIRKDLLSVCGIVLGSTAVSRHYLLACCGGLLEASSAPLGGTSFGPLGGLRGLILTLLTALGAPLLDLSWAALGRSWRLLGGPWGPFGASWAALGAPWAAPKPLSAEKPDFVDSTAFFMVFGASESSPGAS